MGARSFDIAVEVIDEGFRGDEAVAEWMERIEAEGERYCPIAYEIIVSAGFMEVPLGEVEPVDVPVVSPLFDPFFEGQYFFAEVPGEPFVEAEEF